MTTTDRHHTKGRTAALLLTLLLGLGLMVTPAAPATGVQQRATAAVTTVRTGPASANTASGVSLRHHTSRHHASSSGRFHTTKTRKKSGFFKKLGVFLLVVAILVILFIALLIWFLVWLVRRAFGRGHRG